MPELEPCQECMGQSHDYDCATCGNEGWVHVWLGQPDERPIWKQRGFRTYEAMAWHDEAADRGVDVGD